MHITIMTVMMPTGTADTATPRTSLGEKTASIAMLIGADNVNSAAANTSPSGRARARRAALLKERQAA